MKNVVPDFMEDVIYETIEEGLYTSCPICGTPLDWEVSFVYNDVIERHELRAISASCGYTFRLSPIWDSTCTLEGYGAIMSQE